MRQRFLIAGLLFALAALVVSCHSVEGKPDVHNQTGFDALKALELKIRNEMYKQQIEGYKEIKDDFKWFIGILIAIVLAGVGYIGFTKRREYKEILEDARRAREDIRNWEKEARERLSQIDKEVAKRLKEIEGEGKTQIKALAREAEKRLEESREEADRQRKISELWSKGSKALIDEDYESAAKSFQQIAEDLKEEDIGVYYDWGLALAHLARRKKGDEVERLLAEAITKFEKAVVIKPDFYKAYDGWGTAFLELARCKEDEVAERLFAEAITKYEKAVVIKPDFHEAYYGWGTALLDLAKRKEGDERKRLLEEAREKCLKAESIKRGAGAYNLACANCLLGDEDECRRWLKVGEEEKTLPTRGRAMKDEDLESVRNKEWFKALRWKGE